MNCPNCGGVLAEAPDLVGQLVSCPICRQAFGIPAATVALPPVIAKIAATAAGVATPVETFNPYSFPSRAGHSIAKPKKRGGAKTWMIALTVLWFPCCVLGWFIAGVLFTPTEQSPAGGGMVMVGKQGGGFMLVSESDLANYIWSHAWSGVWVVTVGYAALMFMLFVFWFASTDHSTK
ncbi:MAG TPA: hypothetical protein VFE24_03740 [Pirellulales bacterium]|jgi:hypothetical protein|nr:hypothetical protein [Pirellulales bacterium]